MSGTETIDILLQSIEAEISELESRRSVLQGETYEEQDLRAEIVGNIETLRGIKEKLLTLNEALQNQPDLLSCLDNKHLDLCDMEVYH